MQRTRKTSAGSKSRTQRQPRRRAAAESAEVESSTTIVIKVTPSVRQQWRKLSARWKDLLPKLRNGETLKDSLVRVRDAARRAARSQSSDGATETMRPASSGPRDEPPREERRTRVSIKYPG